MPVGRWKGVHCRRASVYGTSIRHSFNGKSQVGHAAARHALEYGHALKCYKDDFDGGKGVMLQIHALVDRRERETYYFVLPSVSYLRNK